MVRTTCDLCGATAPCRLERYFPPGCQAATCDERCMETLVQCQDSKTCQARQEMQERQLRATYGPAFA